MRGMHTLKRSQGSIEAVHSSGTLAVIPEPTVGPLPLARLCAITSLVFGGASGA